MEPVSIALAAAALVAARAAEGGGTAVSDAVRDALTRLYESVRGRFAGDAEVTASIARVEAQPTDRERTAELARTLQARLAADPAFAEQLQRLVDDVPEQGRGAAPTFTTTVQDNAVVGKITTIGEIRGDVQF